MPPLARVAPRTPFGGGGTDIDTTPGTAGAAIAGEGTGDPMSASALAPRWLRPTAVPPRHLAGRPGGAHRWWYLYRALDATGTTIA